MSFQPARARFGWASAVAVGAFAVVFVPMAGRVAAQHAEREVEVAALALDSLPDAATRVTIDTQTKVEGEGSVRVDTAWPTTVCLAEVERPDVDGAQLVYSAMVKPALEGSASLEMWAHVGGGQYFSRNPSVAVSGRGDFQQLEIPFLLQKGQRPDKVTLNLIVQGKGTVWVDDVRLIKRPLSGAAQAPTPRSAAKPEVDASSGDRPPYPVVVSTSPERGATGVDPSVDEIRVTFDRPMRRGDHSWTGGGDDFPTIDKARNVAWPDDRTCVLPVKLRSGKFYRVGINSSSYENFKSADGKPAAHTAICFTTAGAKRSVERRAAAPQVKVLSPEPGATDVDPSLDRITVEFDSPMGEGMSWVKADGGWPGAEGRPAEWSRDGRSCSLPVDLDPGLTYKLQLNGSHYVNFQSKWGVPLAPVEWTFTTASE
ncbi:Ig-like domain-containing protein [Botrimarina sp.]|uniref:Ig-like domain-containing protein n=1 Tax=Botrimarina sp. TaxID=2795802 RepID=UPI0032EC0482